MGRTAALSVLLASLAAVALPFYPVAATTPADPPVTLRLVAAPETADAAGAPFAVLVEVRGTPGHPVELRAEAGPPATVLTRTWNGFAWQRSDRYLPEVALDSNGAWTGLLELRAKEADPEGETRLRVKARVDGRVAAEVEAPLRFTGAAAAAWGRAPPGAAAVALAEGHRIIALDAARHGAVAHPGNGTLLRFLDDAGGILGDAPRPPPPALRVAAVAPHAFGDGTGEFVVVENPGATPVDLAGACIETRKHHCFHESTIVAAGSTIALTGNATRYARENTRPADAEAPMHLPDRGGRVALTAAGRVLHAVEYPDVTPGEVWTPDPHDRHTRAGWTQIPARPLSVEAPFTAYVTPTAGTPLLSGFIAAARHTLDVALYTFESPHLAHALTDAAARGVRVRVLLEGAPVGGVSPEQEAVVAHLLAHGVEVGAMEGVPDRPARYATMHAKYVVRDGGAVHVASENWNGGAYPPGPREGGNRGWGLAVEDATVAHALAQLFEADFAGADVARPRVPDAPPLVVTPAPPFGEEAGMTVVTRAEVSLLLAPDNALDHDGLPRLIANATRTIDVQLLRVDPHFREGPNPLVEALVAAAERGVRVRVLLDDTYRDPGNRAVLERLNAIAAARGLPIEARPTPGGFTLHNKGLLVDGEAVVVGSINWGEAALTRNREVALLVRNEALASWFGEAFEKDWDPPSPDERTVEAAPWATVGGLLAAAARVAGTAARATANPSRLRSHMKKLEGK